MTSGGPHQAAAFVSGDARTQLTGHCIASWDEIKIRMTEDTCNSLIVTVTEDKADSSIAKTASASSTHHAEASRFEKRRSRDRNI